jgi:D-hydroxyproline dehydrogenase subunit gamma
MTDTQLTHHHVQLTINGQAIRVPAGSTVAAAIARLPVEAYRHSVQGEARAPLCGMGICYECRVTINQREHTLSCQTLCEEGMVVTTT